MSVSLTSSVIEMELAGAGGGWTDVSADVLHGVRCSYGIRGTTMNDRVASPGQMTFLMRNSAGNSGGVAGYYSPNHASARGGFDLGIAVRWSLTYSGVTYYVFRGTIESIDPKAGSSREQSTEVVVVDWMEELARATISGVATQLNVTSGAAIQTVVDAIDRQPPAQAYWKTGSASSSTSTSPTGQASFAYVLDRAEEGTVSALTECQRIVLSEAGQLFQKRDTVQGGTLVFADRQHRETTYTPVVTLTNTMIEVEANRGRRELVNHLDVVTHPRRVDEEATSVLYKAFPTAPIGTGQTVVFLGQYRDPNQEAARVGGTDMVTPVATTDYAMNTELDGSGGDVTSDFTVTTALGGNGVRFTVQNNGSSPAFVTFIQVRGRGLYDFNATIYETEDLTSIAAYGKREGTYNMPYMDDAATAEIIGDYWITYLKNPQTVARGCRFLANRSDALMTAALTADVGSRVGIVETQTGLNQQYDINAVGFDLTATNKLWVEWILFPHFDTSTGYHTIEDPVNGVLDTSLGAGDGGAGGLAYI